METANSYQKRFIPFIFAAAVLSLCGGFTSAVPANIVSDWALPRSAVTWLTLAYALGAAAMSPIMGKLGDVLGRRAAMVLGLSLFTAGQLLMTFCPAGNVALAVLIRFVAGTGAAAIAPMVMSFIMTEFPSEKTSQGFTIYMVVSCTMVIFGPTLGGLLLHYSGWRSVMLVCTALCLMALIACLTMIQRSPSRGKSLADFDFPGAILTLILFSMLLAVPTLAQSTGYRAAVICLAIGAAALIALIFSQRRAKNPILSGRFMARRAFILPIIVLFLSQGLLQSCMTNIITFAIVTANDRTLSGIATSVMYVGMALGTVLIGPMADRREPRGVAAVSLVFVAAGAALQLLFTHQTPLFLMCAAMFLIGLGLGGNGIIFMKIVLADLPPALAGSGSGTYNVFRDMSAPFGVALFVPMFSDGLTAQTAVSALHATARVQTLCVAAGIFVCLFLPRIYRSNA